MYAQGKYVVGEILSDNDTLAVAVAICFPETVQHSTFRNMFSEIWGGGFFCVHKDSSTSTGLAAKSFGKSVSLGVESNAERDDKLLNKALGLNPY